MNLAREPFGLREEAHAPGTVPLISRRDARGRSESPRLRPRVGRPRPFPPGAGGPFFESTMP